MKLKFINLLLASVLLGGSAQIFTSCKDNEADMFVNLQEETITLDQRLKDVENTLIPNLDKALKDEIAAREQKDKELNDAIEALQKQSAADASDIKTLQNDVAQALKDAAANASDIATLQEALKNLGDLKAYIDEQDGKIIDRVVEAEKRLTEVEEALKAIKPLEDRVDAVEDAIKTINESISILPDVAKDAAAAKAQAEKNKKDIEALEKRVKKLEDDAVLTAQDIQDIKDQLEGFATKQELKDAVEALEKQAKENLQKAYDYTDKLVAELKDDLNKTIGELRDDMEKAVKELQDEYDALKKKVDANTDEIKALNEKVGKLVNRIEEVAGRVNGVIIQQTDNAVLGTLNLPVGINSMMLLGWWGEMDHAAEFPTANPENGYMKPGVMFGQPGYYDHTAITLDDLNRIGITPKAVPAGYKMETNAEGKGVIGKLYVTINPSNAAIDDKDITIVNSLGKALPIELNFVPSNKELKHGYTRATSANGFYESEAVIDISNNKAIDAIKLSLNPDLKHTVAQIIKEGRKSIDARTIAKLADALYDQINGVLPALAISVSWNDSETGAMQVNSNYGLAAAALHARNLALLNQLDTKNYKIPNLPALSELQDRFDVWFDKVAGEVNIKLNAGDFKITLDKITVEVKNPTVSLKINNGIEADIDANAEADKLTFTVVIDDEEKEAVASDVTIPVKGTATITPENMQGFINDLSSSINEALAEAMQQLGKDFTENINAQLQKAADKIAGSVKELFASMESDINSQIGDVLDFIQNSVDSKFEALDKKFGGIYDRVQELINRLNDVLSEPSHYIQPVLLYHTDSKAGILSTDANHPKTFIAKGNNAAVKIIATTYTLETVVPLYQKYVAITNVWKNGNVGGETELEVLREINSVAGSNLNTVMPAQFHTVALELKKGYTYEIVYQGMDFDGLVSGNKYYVTVK